MAKGKDAPLPETRRLAVAGGVLEYTLVRKRVKNLNVRVGPDGAVAASAPARMPLGDIEAFLQAKAVWIQNTQARMRQKPAPLPCRYTKAECLALFRPVSARVFPLFAEVLCGQMPTLRVREMKSRWGSCIPHKRVITLNMRLAEKPREALEYVVLHEYVHFLHPHHGPAFHAEMARLMPDYKARKKLLRD